MSDKQFPVAHILDLIDSSGEDEVRDRLSVFSCPLNPEVDVRVKMVYGLSSSSLKNSRFYGMMTMVQRMIFWRISDGGEGYSREGS